MRTRCLLTIDLKLLFIIALSLNSYVVKSQCRLDYSNYHLVFEDNFDTYTNVDQLSAKWQFTPNPSTFGWGGSDGEYYDKSKLSLQPGGYLRLTANKLSTPATVSLPNGTLRHPNFVSGMIQLRSDFYDPEGWKGWEGNSGYTYGMFEIRCKLPSKGSFPAFWLYQGPTEIDIFEANGGADPTRVSNNVIDWTKPDNDPQRGCQDIYVKHSWDDMTTLFHTFTCVWTESAVTFFFDGREMRTVYASQIPTYKANATIIANLAMWPWSEDGAFMDIDYIKVWKPNGGNYTLPYKNTHAWMPNNISGPVRQVTGSVAPNPSNNNEVFFTEVSSLLYKATKSSNGQWTTADITPAGGVSTQVHSDLKYHPNNGWIIYNGWDGRLQYLAPNGSAYTHGWFGDLSAGSQSVASEPASVYIAPNGDIVYKGYDNKIHRFYYSNNTWQHQLISYTYGQANGYAQADYVKGDVLVDKAKAIYYKGFDNRVQIFYLDQNQQYNHGWVDDFWSTSDYTVNSRPGSMCFSDPYGIIYVGTDNKVHRLYWGVNDWQHELLPYTYSQNEFVRGNIVWDEAGKRILYTGNDGRVQYFAFDNGVLQYHGWIDDYWNTSDYSTFSSVDNANYSSSLTVNSNSSIFYVKRNNQLGNFTYASCEVANPACGQQFVANKINYSPESGRIDFGSQLKLFPNPASSVISVNISSIVSTGSSSSYKIVDAKGNLLQQGVIEESNESIDISGLKSGIYLMIISDGNRTYKEKFVKQ